MPRYSVVRNFIPYIRKSGVELPQGFYIVKIADSEADVYQGVQGDGGQICITFTLVNDWCGYTAFDTIKEKQAQLSLVCRALQEKIDFTYEIRVGVSFG